MKNGTVLVVDDIELNRVLLKSLLGDTCYVVSASGASEAFGAILSMDKLPDMILLELMMAGMSGLEFMEILNGTNYSSLPIMVITSSQDKRHEQRAISLGAIDFMTRPYNPNTLKQRVKNNLELVRSRSGSAEAPGTGTAADGFLETLACVAENAKTGGTTASEERVARLRRKAEVLVHTMLKRNKFMQALINRDCDSVIKAMPVHDIGKIGISNSILQKPGKLTFDEFEQIKRHTLIGADFVERIIRDNGESAYLRNCYDICRYHHERWDGKGYPDGLAAERIPLPARINSLLDSYDALTRNTPYRKAASHHEAVDIIAAGSATQFDPYLIDCFMEANERLKEA